MKTITRIVDQGRTRITGPARLVLPPKTQDLEAVQRLAAVRARGEAARPFTTLVELLYWMHAKPGEDYPTFLRRNLVSISPTGISPTGISR